MDDAGKIVREVKVANEPDALLAILTNRMYHFNRRGLIFLTADDANGRRIAAMRDGLLCLRRASLHLILLCLRRASLHRFGRSA